jgi:hypothetical protein
MIEINTLIRFLHKDPDLHLELWEAEGNRNAVSIVEEHNTPPFLAGDGVPEYGVRLNRELPRHAPAGTKIKLPWIEELVNDLLNPVGRARRAKAVRDLGCERTDVPSRALIPAAKPANRWGWVLAAVTEVLGAAREPMRARMIHMAVEELVGEPVSGSSVKNCLASDVGGKSPRFERVGRGRYRLTSDGRAPAPHRGTQ